MNFYGKKIAILGWGINGLDIYKYLQKSSTEISIYDQKKKEDLDLSGIDEKRVNLFLGETYLDEGLCDYDFIFRAPGVYRYIPEIVKAEKAGVSISSVAKIFFDLCQGKIIGVTGTKGKGTTSTLIYEILKKSNADVYLAGNIGTPMLGLLPKLKNDSWVILELSSFQLIDLNKSPHISVILNITSDHLDWHKDQGEYVEAKKNIARFQNLSDFKVVNYDYDCSKSFSNLSLSKNYYFSTKGKVSGVFIKDGFIYSNIGGGLNKIGRCSDLLLRGEHNWENVCAAVCVSQLAAADIDLVKKVVFSFKGLEHRLELIGEINGIKYYNDSFSTNPQTTLAAVKSFSEPITLIFGGYDKGLNFEEAVKYLCVKNNLKNIILIGDTENKLYKLLNESGCDKNLIKMGKSGMEKIVNKCKSLSEKGGIVLLSPGFASFDMFSDYKDRGKRFKNAVSGLLKAS